MNNNTNWTSATTNELDIIESLISLFKSNRSGHIERRINSFSDVAFPLTKKKDYSIWDYDAIWNPKGDLPKVNTVEWDLYFNYIPCFSTREARENYINEGVLHKDLAFGIGILTPVKKSDLQILFPERDFKSCNYTWYIKNPQFLINDKIKEIYCIVMEEKVFDENNFLLELEKNIKYIKNYPLNNE